LAQDSNSNLGSSLIVAAVIVGLSIVTGSFMMKTAHDQSSEQLAAVLGEMQDLSAKVAAAPAAAGRPSAPSRPGRPDPSKVYKVDIGDAPAKGPRTAKVKIVEWSDFQCPFCGRAGPTLEQVQKEYGEQVQIVFKHLPLSMHKKAPGAHAAAEAASRQGKFWEFHDKLFANQRQLDDATYLKYAEELGLDIPKFKADSASPAVKARIAEDMAQASKLGVTGTPAFFVNGRFLSGAQPFPAFKTVIDEALAKN
jgi:protein-disulfide isomerase